MFEIWESDLFQKIGKKHIKMNQVKSPAWNEMQNCKKFQIHNDFPQTDNSWDVTDGFKKSEK